MSTTFRKALPSDLPKELSVSVQRDTESAGYVATVYHYVIGMRFAALHTRAYGDTPEQAWDRAVEQVQTNILSLL